MKAHLRLPVFLVAVLICTLIAPTTVAAPHLQLPVPLDAASTGPMQDENGLWFMPPVPATNRQVAGAQDPAELRAIEASRPGAAALAGGGGPDDFGYTWTDEEPLAWIDAAAGIDTGLDAATHGAGPFDIGFPFRFYENVRSQLYVSRHGFINFSGGDLSNSQSVVPGREYPNEVIAPHWAPVYAIEGYVRYLRGGAEPNRWFVVEWNRLRSTEGQADQFTFEAILHENGDIVFQYGTMAIGTSWVCQASGIEDTSGTIGLSVTDFCTTVGSDHAIRIDRPAPGARVSFTPRLGGAFGTAGQTVRLEATVRNTGDFGADTFDFSSESAWPVSLFHGDGVTPLADTDADGQPDSGPLAVGASRSIVVKTAIPAGSAVGVSNTAEVTAASSVSPSTLRTSRFQAAVPAAFAQSYTLSDRPKVGLYRPGQQTTHDSTNESGYSAAAATTPTGKLAQVWVQHRTLPGGQWADELYFHVLDRRGDTVIPATRITDLSAAVTPTYDGTPAVAVAPDGNIGIIWQRYTRRGDDEFNTNIHLMILNPGGEVVLPPTNLTNDSAWYTYDADPIRQYAGPNIAATSDPRFGLVWTRYQFGTPSYSIATWYAVYGSGGAEVCSPTQFSDNGNSGTPNLSPLGDGTLLLLQRSGAKLGYGRIDSAGVIVTPPTTYTTPASVRSMDAAQLPNGAIVIAWTSGRLYYLLLDASLNVVRESTALPDLSPATLDYPSVVASGARAVITWGHGGSGGQPNLYYALLNGAGDVVTPPVVFVSDNTTFSALVPYNGQGATILPDELPLWLPLISR